MRATPLAALALALPSCCMAALPFPAPSPLSGPALAAAAEPMAQPGAAKNSPRTALLAAICYHRFGLETRLDPYCMSPQRLAGELSWLRANGWKSVSLTQVAAALDGDAGALPAKGVLLSVDDGYKAGELGAPVFERYGFRAVYFVVPDMLGHGAFLSYRDLRELEARGHEVASHTLSHPDLALVPPGMDPAAYARWVDLELREPKELLEKALGHPVDALAWPYGTYNPAVSEAARRAGYRQLWNVSGGVNRVQGLDPSRLRRIVLVGHPPLASFARRLRSPPLRTPVDCLSEGGLFYRSQLPTRIYVPQGVTAALASVPVTPDAAGGLTLSADLPDGFYFLNLADEAGTKRGSASYLFQVAPDAWKACFDTLAATPAPGRP
ncbi:MAG TPA: polysaccharide deacetylase family protein [bacterium]|nr:polysaccharide deacetylase family protein [bacterium]